MPDRTGIEWTDATWNPIRGCTRVSEGCRHCYAESVAARFSGPGQPYHDIAELVERPGGAKEARWTGKIAFVESALMQPLRWRRPRMIFVNSMSDLFHEVVPDEWIDRIFAVMALCPQHTFQVLTKRPERMREYLRASGAMLGRQTEIREAIQSLAPDGLDRTEAIIRVSGSREACTWRPLPNVWLGVSVEDQATADTRIPILLDTPATIRWISAEPLLGPIDLRGLDTGRQPQEYEEELTDALTGQRFWSLDGRSIEGPRGSHLDWVVAGGESGPGARPPSPLWFAHLRDEAADAGVAFLFKQWGQFGPANDHIPTPAERLVFVTVEGDVVSAGEAEKIDAFEVEAGLTPRTRLLARVGKKRAGRLLDGVLHDAYPEVR